MAEEAIPRIDILLSTYNGARYLKELLGSLEAQTYKNWRLIIRDDGSTDESVEMLKTLQPDKALVLRDGPSHLGACQSFARLLEASDAPYVMFCDQDDVWLPGKIETTLEAMMRLEARSGVVPLLVHTDLKVVDERLNLIAESFWRYQHINPAMTGLNRLLIINVATGCAMMFNRALKKAALPMPDEAILHDWWMTLVAAALGKIEYMDSPTILYRQHGKNETGAMKYSLGYFISRMKSLNKTVSLLRRIVAQGKAFFSLYKNMLPKELSDTVYNFATLLDRGRFIRLYMILKFRYYGCGFLRNLGIILALWTLTEDSAGSPSSPGKTL